MKVKKLLLVEDEAFIALEIRSRLQSLGYEVCAIAASGRDALTKASDLRPDLVLMDIRLPGGMSGIEAAVRVRDEYGIPVVFLTALADEETLSQARAAEPYGYLLKPFQERELRIGIEMALHQHAMERRIRESEEKFRLVTESIDDVFWLNSLDLGELFYVSPAYETIWERTSDSLYRDPKSFLDSVHPDDRAGVLSAFSDPPKKGMEIEYRLLAADGTLRWIRDRRFAVCDPRGLPYRLAGIATDITEQKVAQEQLLDLNRRLEQQATHDSLTGLPNSRLFIDRLEQTLAHARRFGGRVGILFVDLDGFKSINDCHGHQAGDQALILMAQRLRKALREVDTAARLGGDEFGVVIPELASDEDAKVVAKKIIDHIGLPFTLTNLECRLGASIGISFFPDHGNSPEELISRADNAMYHVKQTGKGGVRVCDGPPSPPVLEVLDQH
jgi:diguanylate cyclase (GGDEF)-like protein/PAS domain S-box-containing protein